MWCQWLLYDCRKRRVFRFLLKTASVGAKMTDDGNSFHMWVPATPKVWSPTVRSLVRGNISWSVNADRRRRWELSSVTQCRSLARYSGAVLLQQQNISTASRYLMHCGTRNQWRPWGNEVTWSYLLEPFIRRAAAWHTDCSQSSRYPGTPASSALP